MSRLPPWIRTDLRTDRGYTRVDKLLAGLSLNTVCLSAHCPNRHACWNRATATFMILGNRCTRRCKFCAVESGLPMPPDPREPDHVAQASVHLKLRHVVITSVTRDDLPDGGAGHFAATVRAVKQRCPEATVEVLIPDFQGKETDIQTVLEAGPTVLNHNLETVRRLQPVVRPQASYARSLGVLCRASAFPDVRVKSGLMLGMGETEEELLEALADLYQAGCRLLTLGQYLAPTAAHYPVARFVTPEEFDRFGGCARDIGFDGVASGPMVRSSYHADELLATAGVGG